jgi:hypothetical protein
VRPPDPVPAAPTAADLPAVVAEAKAGSWSAKLRLAAAAFADDDPHMATYLAIAAVDGAGTDPAALADATRLLAAHEMWDELLPPARLLDDLVPAYADAVPVVLACRGGLPADLVDRRRDRIDRIVELAAAHPTAAEPRLLALGVLAGLARANWPMLAEYRHRLADLVAGPPPSFDRETLANVIRARLG